MTEFLKVQDLHSNPYQPVSRRTFTREQLADLDSIATIGLQQTPKARQVEEGYQLLFGHRRVAWWSLHCPDKPMPVEVEAASDREMFEAMIVENADRLEPNAIERAQTLKAYMEAFAVKQAEAGKLFNIQTQGGVSNLLRLLELPVEIQALVAGGGLPERLARRLLALRSLDAEKAIIALAEETAGHSNLESDLLISKKNAFTKNEITQEQLFEAKISSLVSQRGHILHRMPWDKKWKPGISADILGERIELPACEKCPFARRMDYAEFCLRPACWSAKLNEHARLETKKAAETKHLVVAAEGEKVTIIADPDQVRALLASKSQAVRLLPRPDAPRDYYNMEQAKKLTGSPFAQIGVLAAEAKQVLASVKPAPQKVKPKSSSPTDWKKKQADEEAKRKAYMAAQEQIVANLTPAIARLLPNDATALAVLVHVVSDQYYPSDNTEKKIAQAARFDDGRLPGKPADWKAFIAHAILDYVEMTMDKTEPSALREEYMKYAARFGLKLPAGWDAHLVPPAEKAAPAKAKGKGKKK